MMQTSTPSWVATFFAHDNSKKRKPRPLSFPPLLTNLLVNANRMQTPCMLLTNSTRLITTSPGSSWQLSEATRHLPPYLIVIDALDDDGGSAFLRNLLIVINEYDLRGLKFLVTSRSDPKVATLCKSFASEAVCRLQDVPIEEAKLDIETYLKTQLPELTSSPEFAELGQRAGGLFNGSEVLDSARLDHGWRADGDA